MDGLTTTTEGDRKKERPCMLVHDVLTVNHAKVNVRECVRAHSPVGSTYAMQVQYRASLHTNCLFLYYTCM